MGVAAGTVPKPLAPPPALRWISATSRFAAPRTAPRGAALGDLLQAGQRTARRSAASAAASPNGLDHVRR